MNFIFKTVPKVAIRISGHSPFWSVYTIVSFWYFVISRKFFGRHALYPATLRFKGTAMTLYMRDFLDVMTIQEVYKEIFLETEYDWELVGDVRTIIDLGAHIGDTSLYYHLKYPAATIVAVEPLPDNVARIKRATREYPEIKVVEGAVGSENTNVDFHITPSTLGSSLISREKATHAISVRKKMLRTICDEAQITAPVDLIKFDIEGGEFELFSHINPEEYARAYIGELHFDFVPGATMDGFCKSFSKFDYTLSEMEGYEGKRYMFMATQK